MTEYCPKCGSPHGPGASFCTHCGTLLMMRERQTRARGGERGPVENAPYSVSPGGVLQASVLPYGGFWIRLAAAILDWIVMTVLGMAVVLPIPTSNPEALGSLIGSVVGFAYTTGCTPIWGATPGKLLLGYHIVGNDGRHISYWRALVREISKSV